jgi:hypothetical protein
MSSGARSASGMGSDSGPRGMYACDPKATVASSTSQGADLLMTCTQQITRAGVRSTAQSMTPG